MQVNRCYGCMEEISSSTCPHCGYDPDQQHSVEYALQPGTILHGRYLVGKVLGQGGFGITYIGLDIPLSRKIAIKEYFPSAHAARSAQESCTVQWYVTAEAKEAHTMGREIFLKEARKMSRVSSIPQGVRVQDMFEDNGTAYIIMEYVPGEDLAQRLERQGPMPWEEVRKLLLPVTGAMQKFHEAGMIHRDLSPDNLKVLPDGSIKILDMGAAKDIGHKTTMASVDVAKGGFSPTEQYFMSGNIGPWSDVYSLAATIYFALTGIAPPSALDRMEKDTIRWNLPQLRKVPAPVIQALKQAMAVRAESRTQTMTEFAENLCRPDTGRKGKKTGLILGAAAALVAVVVLVVALLPGKGAAQEDIAAQESQSAETTEPTEEIAGPWKENILMAAVIPDAYRYEAHKASVFGSRISRNQIVSVTFLDSLSEVGENSWDVSQSRDRTVMAWTIPNGTITELDADAVAKDAYDLYIAAEEGINGQFCKNLFKGYQNLESVAFNDCYHTDYAESMEGMFSGCYNLVTLDVSGLVTRNVRSMANMFTGCPIAALDVSNFDTSNVENMQYMFSSCDNLTALDLRSFDTSKVTDMGDMFSSAYSLKTLDISSFDTSNVTDMSFMFTYTGLTELDLSHFRTPKLTSIAYMFSGSSSLKIIDVSNFDVSNVSSMQGTFRGCSSMEEIIGLENWDLSGVDYHDEFMDKNVTVDGIPWKDLFK